MGRQCMSDRYLSRVNFGSVPGVRGESTLVECNQRVLGVHTGSNLKGEINNHENHDSADEVGEEDGTLRIILWVALSI